MDLNRIYGSLCWILLIIIQIYHQSDAVQVNILDTTKTESLGWVTYSKDDGDAGRRGWKEASYTNSDGDVFRVYTVCNIVNVAVDNWMRTPFIPRGSANRLYIEVKFTMRKCTKYPDPGRLQQCKESFKLLYYEADSDFANTMMPTWDSDTYKHIDVIAADRVFAEVNEAIINTETRSVSLTHGGVYFAFQDEGACSTVLSIRIYHIICPSVVANFAIFPNTSTGLELTSVSQKDGICVENSAMFQQPSYLCQADGNWYYPTGGCDCLPGYQPLADTSQCIACPMHSYKWTSSNNQCLRCPQNSDSFTNGSVSCKCHEGFYRSLSDSPDDACTGPPSAVRNLTVVQHDHSSVLLSWLPPSDFGGRKQLSYRVECHKCEENTVFAPQRSGFNTTRVSVAGLLPQKQYTFTVYSENDITHMTEIVRRSDVTVLTDAAVAAKVTNVHVTNVGTDFVSVVWEPSRDPDNFVDLYEVKYWMMERAANTSSVFSNHTNVTLINLAHQTKYTLQVRGKTSKGWGEFSESVFAVTTNVFHYPSQGPAVVIAGSLVAVLLCFVIGCIMMVVFVRRNRRLYGEKNVSDRIALNAGRGQCSQTIDGALINSVANVSCDLLHGSQRSYIDPHTYEDPSEAVKEFTKEIDVSCVVIESVIGGGEFGDVCKGKLIIPGKTDLSVAIKTLKPGSSEKSICDFLTEASIMGQFDDPNVIYLEGVITKTSPIMIITEYMENGSLDKFLRQNDSKLTILQLAGMMRGVASGMRYLAEMGFVHRDLAARNVVVSGTLVCKVTDFGLSREVEMDSSSGSYTTKGGKIPIRWTAPEAIAYRKFTSSSDVWSYGIVMWEVMSYGEWPYWDWSNQDMIEAIDRDYRLPPPMDCPEAIYQLMQDCWQKERTHRPKFSCVVQTLDKLIRSPELLQKIVQNRPEYNVLSRPNSDSSSTPCMTVSEWLMTLKMDRYSEVLNDAGYRTLADVSQIRQCDLVRLGITLAGHQKKLLNGVRNLHSTVGPFDPSTSSFV